MHEPVRLWNKCEPRFLHRVGTTSVTHDSLIVLEVTNPFVVLSRRTRLVLLGCAGGLDPSVHTKPRGLGRCLLVLLSSVLPSNLYSMLMLLPKSVTRFPSQQLKMFLRLLKVVTFGLMRRIFLDILGGMSIALHKH